MTDLEKTVELYRGFGIECKVNKFGGGFDISLNGHDEGSTCSDKFEVSYIGFYSTLFFNEQGEFIKQGFWE